MRTCRFGLSLLAVISFFGYGAWAQTVTGSISGVVVDESSAVVPGANVTVTNVDTGIGRSVVTDAAGRYDVPGLIPDHYEVQAQIMGFETAVRSGIQLTVGSKLEINLTLKVGQVAQKTVVTAEAPLVETLSGSVSGLVDDKAIRDLPLNGRSFDQLISLESSAPIIRLAGHSLSTGTTTTYSVNGARDQSNVFLMDGTELVGAGRSSLLPDTAVGVNLGVDAIREFTVLTSNYSAAYGKRAGGIINLATRSGTNQIHGSAFEFLRNSDLDARNFFDPGGGPPPFRRNQFGGAVGGPIRKDQTFFFGTYEGLRQNLGETNIETVPDNNARQGILPDLQNPGQFFNVGVAPQVKPFLVVFPPANGRNFGDGTAQSITNPNQVSSEDFFIARIDHKISDKDSVFGRYNFDQSNQHLSSNILLFGPIGDSTAHVLTLEETRTYASTLNTIRFGFSRATTVVNNLPTVPLDPSLVFYPGADSIGSINFGVTNPTANLSASLTSQGTGNSGRQHLDINQFDLADQLFHQLGPHALQFGVQVQRFQDNQQTGVSSRGNFQFNSFTDFLQGNVLQFTAPSPVGGHDATKAYRQTYLAGYFQDDYKVTRNLTLNLGVRYEFMTPPIEDSGNRISNWRPVYVSPLWMLNTNPIIGSPVYKDSALNFAPRFGFAWDTFGDGKMAIRGGFGIFYDQIQSEYRAALQGAAPFYTLVTVAHAPFPNGFAGGPGVAPLPSPQGIDFNFSTPERLQYHLNMQRQITPNTAFIVGYVGSHSYHLSRQWDANTARPQILPGNVDFYPPNDPRINPALSSSSIYSTDATAFYNSLQLSFLQRLSHGLRSKVSFTYAKSIDNATAIVSTAARGTPGGQDPDNPGLDRSLSGFDQRRNLVANFTYDLPFNRFSGAPGRLLGGWQASAIFTISDGMPFTVLTGFNQSRDLDHDTNDRPSLAPGASINPILGGPQQYFNPRAFVLPQAGFYGNLGRDTLISPGFETLDFTLLKATKITERLNAEFRADFFNILNHANFDFPSSAVFSSNGQYRGAAGSITDTVSSSRQIQFGFKLLF